MGERLPDDIIRIMTVDEVKGVISMQFDPDNLIDGVKYVLKGEFPAIFPNMPEAHWDGIVFRLGEWIVVLTGQYVAPNGVVMAVLHMTGFAKDVRVIPYRPKN